MMKGVQTDDQMMVCHECKKRYDLSKAARIAERLKIPAEINIYQRAKRYLVRCPHCLGKVGTC